MTIWLSLTQREELLFTSFSTEWSISYAYFNVIRPPILPKNLEFDMVIDYTEWAGNLILMILDRKFTTSFDNYSDEIFTVETCLPFMHCLMYSGSPTLPKHQKIVKIFHRPTNKPTLWSSVPELKIQIQMQNRMKLFLFTLNPNTLWKQLQIFPN